MVERGYRLQEHRLAGPGRCDDQRALAVADRRNQVDASAGEFGPAWPASRFDVRGGVGVGGGQRREVGATYGVGRILAVDGEYLDGGDASPVIASRRGAHFIGLAQAMLTGKMAGNVSVTRFFEVAVAGAPNETGITGWGVPSGRFAVQQ